MKDLVRVNFDFPKEDYFCLKMLCLKSGVSMRKHISSLIMQSLEEFEDKRDCEIAKERLSEMKDEDLIPFDDACRDAGWNN